MASYKIKPDCDCVFGENEYNDIFLKRCCTTTYRNHVSAY